MSFISRFTSVFLLVSTEKNTFWPPLLFESPVTPKSCVHVAGLCLALSNPVCNVMRWALLRLPLNPHLTDSFLILFISSENVLMYYKCITIYILQFAMSWDEQYSASQTDQKCCQVSVILCFLPFHWIRTWLILFLNPFIFIFLFSAKTFINSLLQYHSAEE